VIREAGYAKIPLKEQAEVATSNFNIAESIDDPAYIRLSSSS